MSKRVVRPITVDQLFSAMRPKPGFTRVVFECTCCGQLYGKQYVERNDRREQMVTYNGCLCQFTGKMAITGIEHARRTP